MTVHIDTGSAVPPFEQLRAQLAAQIVAGDLAPGTKLPTVRALADELGLAVNTVARAYRELEAADLVETRGRAGTVVGSGGDQQRAEAARAAADYAARVRALGITPSDALAIVAAAVENASRTAQDRPISGR